jgi:hypothetical protein
MNTKILSTALLASVFLSSALPALAALADAPVPTPQGTFIGGAAPVPVNLPAPAPVPSQKK